MTKRIAVLGAGAIGSSVGADLTAAGLDVIIVDQWPAQVETMKREGLRIAMPDDSPLRRVLELTDVRAVAPIHPSVEIALA